MKCILCPKLWIVTHIIAIWIGYMICVALYLFQKNRKIRRLMMNLAIKKEIKSKVKSLNDSIISQELEIGKHNGEIQKIEQEINHYKEQLKSLSYGLSKKDKKEIGFD